MSIINKLFKKKEPELALTTSSGVLFDGTRDITYRGKLSFKGLQIVAYFILFLSQIAILAPTMAKAYFAADIQSENSFLISMIRFINSAYSPLLFIAAFSCVLNDPKQIKSNLIKYGLITLGIYAAFNLANIRYAASLIWSLRNTEGMEQIKTFADAINYGSSITLTFYSKFFSVNIFCDVFLWTLVYFFIAYNPKKLFQGKKVVIFRLFSLIPLIYIIGSCALRLMNSAGLVALPIWYAPLLGSGIPLMNLLFGGILLFLILTKRHYIRLGGKAEEFESYRTSNKNSLSFSIFCAAMMIVVSVLDYTALMVISSYYDAGATITTTYGFGFCYGMIFAAPIMLFFCYSKKPKYKLVSLISKASFLGVIAFLYFDAYFLYACQLIEKGLSSATL